MEECRRVRRPTAEEVIAKLKDDGDFDSLRLKIIHKIKENEELRNSIIMEVKQSEILNQDGSENLKPRQLSDAIYKELGKKIMGQISDEVWKVIRNDSTKDDIRGTVESVYNRIVNPKPKEEDHHSSPSKDNTDKQNGLSVAPVPAEEANMCGGREPKMPPGSAPSDQHASSSNKAEHKESHHEQLLCLASEQVLHSRTDMVDEDVPPGFAMPISSAGQATVSPDKFSDGGAAEMPPGFEICGDADVDMPPGFGAGVGSGGAVRPGFGANHAGTGDDEDDPDVPPGFG